MAYTLPKLPYAYDALEPAIDARTMDIHLNKHHATYVEKLNAALENQPELFSLPVEELLQNLDKVAKEQQLAVRNHGGGHANHSFFWKVMSPRGGGQPDGSLARAIDQQYTSFEKLQAEFTQTALNRFGSGWAWLVLDNQGQLKTYSTPNQDSPLLEGAHPLLALDVWEHAYYLKYQNVRAEYVKNWWNIVNWSEVAKQFEAAQS
jgi:Fe-Mn family superoxide dismutase